MFFISDSTYDKRVRFFILNESLMSLFWKFQIKKKKNIITIKAGKVEKINKSKTPSLQLTSVPSIVPDGGTSPDCCPLCGHP